MFLVKSCNKEKNVLNINTLKIGTLQEYRKTEQQQILDKEEDSSMLHVTLITFYRY